MASFQPSGGGDLITGTITNVHQKGFAFASTKKGNVFIPPLVHEALGKPKRGVSVNLKVKRGEKSLVALIPPAPEEEEWEEWADWQTGKSQVPIPDTYPGSVHTVSFACSTCGYLIVEGEEIYEIKQGCVWTNVSAEALGSIEPGETFYNKYKKVSAAGAHCNQCNRSLGAIYSKPYYDAALGRQSDRLFPCVKIVITREHKAYDGNDEINNDLVLLAESRSDAEMAVSRLVVAQRHGFNQESVQLRTTSHTFDLKQQLMKAEAAATEAENSERAKEYAMAEARKEAQRAAECASTERRRAKQQIMKAKAEATEAKNSERAKEYALAEARKEAQRAAEDASTERRRREETEIAANLAAKLASVKIASAMAAEDGPRQWSWLGGDEFVPYDSEINALIDDAYDPSDPTSSAPVTWKERGFVYEVDWERSAQVNLNTKTERLIQFFAGPSVFKASVKPWTTPGEEFPDGTVLHSISASSLSDTSDTRELAEFNFAYAQMQRLTSNCNIQVQKVDVYESPSVEANYASTKKSMPQSRELWVFHGTSDNNVKLIMTGGFKVGGRDPGVPVSNGIVHGHGVYTATGPNTPMSYSTRGGSNRVVLALALEGAKGQQGSADCWAPRDDWLIFKTGEQLLPKYVVDWVPVCTNLP